MVRTVGAQGTERTGVVGDSAAPPPAWKDSVIKYVPLTVALLVCLAGNAALAAKLPPKPERAILICHATHARKHPFVLLRVPVSAVHARLRHGDVMPANGACPQAQTAVTQATTASTTTGTTSSS